MEVSGNMRQELDGSRILKPGCHRGRGLAVFTSGGDSQGMNSAVRAVVRFGLYLGCEVYLIKEGYRGLVEGGDKIVKASWAVVSGIISEGGTVIGSARCLEFKERSYRLTAAKNLIEKGITHLVVIGGDGSLTGAHLFQSEWPSLIKELFETGKASSEEILKYSHLNIVGIVGSIDNDFCGTDMTIGADSALHRIIEAVDAIIPTAKSHQRTFIMEVMGRNCGYLALVASIITEADYVFLPEWPPESNWPEQLCRKLKTSRDFGSRLNIIIVAEGAIDRQGNIITCEDVKKVVVAELKQDTRITVLGHVQRGGAPSAFDRILGSRMGAEAVIALMDAKEDTEPCVISLDGNTAVRVPLMKCVKLTQDVAVAMKERNFELAVQLRGRSFQRTLDIYLKFSKYVPHPTMTTKTRALRLGVLHAGAPCCGFNAAVRSFVRTCISEGHVPFGIESGIEGLVSGNIKEISWGQVSGWVCQGGALLGTKRTLPTHHFSEIASQLKKFKIDGLLFIGGFEAYQAVIQLTEERDNYPEFCIPMIILPATISNNVPGTDFSLGADTALNEISEICDRIRQSASGTKRRVFIVETMGGYCGYLATLAGLAGGCDEAYIYEEKFGMKDLLESLEMIESKMKRGNIERGLILNNEKANANYNTDFLYKLYCEEGRGTFSVRKNVLGHMQQGGCPSSFDRSLGTKLGAKATTWLMESCEGGMGREKDSACLLGLRSKTYIVQSVLDLKKETNFETRTWNHMWWMKLRSMMKILSLHASTYELESEETYIEEQKFDL